MGRSSQGTPGMVKMIAVMMIVVMMIVVMMKMMIAVMVMTIMDLREYGEDNGGSPSSPDQKWRVEEEDCGRFSELPVNRDGIRHI